MRKFLKLTVCLLLCVLAFGLVGCKSKKKEVVDTSVASCGNGGMVVTSGEYIYFVNGYSTYETITKSDLNKKYSIGGLYRAKLNEMGQLSYDENGSVKDATLLSDNLVGFESTSLYVFGNYIYYATPTTEVDKNGNLQTSKLDFYKMSISGGSSSRIYQSDSDGADIEYEFYYADGNVYLMIKEEDALYRVCCWGKFSKDKVASDVEDLVLPRDSYDVFNSKSYKNIFYTKKNDDDKFVIYNYNIVSNKEEYRVITDYKTCELIGYNFDHLYYKASKNDYPSYAYVYRVDATKNAITGLKEERITNTEYTSFYFLDYETNGYIAQTDSKTYHISYNAGGVSEATPIADSKIDIMIIKNNYIYFKDGNSIKRINYYDFIESGTKTQEEVVSVDNLNSYDYDIDDNNIYFYATNGTNTYLYSVYIGNRVEGDEFEVKLLGVYDEADIKKDED